MCYGVMCHLFSPQSSPDSPPTDFLCAQPNETFPRSKSMSTMGNSLTGSVASLPRGSRIPRMDLQQAVGGQTGAAVTGSGVLSVAQSAAIKRTDSDSSLSKRLLPKQMACVGGVGNSSHDDDSLSGTESLDSEGKKKDKKKLKLIPKFMRKSEI